MSARRKDRELALCGLYAYEFSKNPIKQVKKDLLSFKNEIQDISSFANKLLDLTIKHFNEFDELIKVKALNWYFERIAIMDKLILRLAVCELLYFPEIPPKVSIDEAIEISKKYSTEKSGKFVNGILDSILTELRQSKRLKKKGRGLKNGKISKTELL